MPDSKTTLRDAIAARCQRGPISYREYIECALYEDRLGYYTQKAERVGRTARHDFYTSESLGRVFARLVADAAVDLLGSAARTHQFVEIAAEPGTSLLSHLADHPFASERPIRQGEPIQIEGPSVVFANEWLDALPFYRLIFRDGQWRERGITVDAEGRFKEVLLEALSDEVAAAVDRLPSQIEDGYELDLPLETETALRDLLAQNWTGLILLFDYGRTLTSLLQDHPSGTARTYQQHKQSSDLLESPGAYDITCDICWTPLVELMKASGLQSITLESQESFLVQRAQHAAQAIISGSAGQFSSDRQTLMQLIHPANMGQRFQVLWARREAAK